ncbi:MAG TPA: CBS domain-containing protein [Syntrophobacteraceae bacterium]|nr:CBS domain-containing protein [Syntrophobacteraceae bacterium]
MADPANRSSTGLEVGLTDQDIYEAMKSIPGYLDITPGDFKELYCRAYRHAVERILGSVLARDIMVADVVFVGADTSVEEVAELMGRRGVSGVPVTDENSKVVGVISEKDFLARMGEAGPKNFMTVIANCLKAKGCIALPIRAKKAGDIMSSPAVTVYEDTPYSEIKALMAQKAINRVPVADREHRLIGIITRNDLIGASARNGTCSATTCEK